MRKSHSVAKFEYSANKAKQLNKRNAIAMQLTKLFLPVLIVCITACSSTPKLQDEPQEDDSKTPQRFILNDGLQVSLIPPNGFTLTPEHYGFTQPESFSRIKVYEVEVPYKTYTARITKETTAESKLQWVEQKAIEVANAVCTLTLLKQAIAGTVFDKQLLVCGDELSSVVVEASYPESANKIHRQAIFDSMVSLNVNTNNELRLFTGLPFKFEDTPGFKITKRFSNSIVLQPVDSNFQDSTVVISHGTANATSIDELAALLITKGYAPENIEILTTSASKLDGIPALTTTAYATNDAENKYWVKQVLSYQNNRFLLVQARTSIINERQMNRSFASLLGEFSFD